MKKSLVMMGPWWRIMMMLVGVDMVIADSCSLPPAWHGTWFHQGFPAPLRLDPEGITGKGTCVKQDSSKSMFVLREGSDSDAFGSCYRCMMIYQKHVNVLQYKESYCEESMDSMESLCATIAGDAPLYTMFRKEDAKLIKCPFKGPFEFTYSKGDSGQTCSYPRSYMDSCQNNTKVRLRYQACLDVKGSESRDESFSCLATWKQGPLRYLVATMNHSHVHTDEARYRCFVFQRKSGGQSNELVFQMAQSGTASCLGLWSVDEGYRTFTMKKLERPAHDRCSFPEAVLRHQHGLDWESVSASSASASDSSVLSVHLNSKGHSLRLRQLPAGVGSPVVDQHATCHRIESSGSSRPNAVRVIAHVKSGCDSGYVCLDFTRKDQNVFQLRHGALSRHPDEACMSYYFHPQRSPLDTFIAANAKNTIGCPFSGRFKLAEGSRDHLVSALQSVEEPSSSREESSIQSVCDSLPSHYSPLVELQAGCHRAERLSLETKCIDESTAKKQKEATAVTEQQQWRQRTKRREEKPPMEFQCNAQWLEEEDWRQSQEENSYSSPTSVTASASRLREVTAPGGPSSARRVLLLSTEPHLRSDNSVGRSFLCITYTEHGDTLTFTSVAACGRDAHAVTAAAVRSTADESYLQDGAASEQFRLSSLGPCAQPLSQEASAAVAVQPRTMLCVVMTVLTAVILY